MPVKAFSQDIQTGSMIYFKPQPEREKHLYPNVASQYPRWSDGVQNFQSPLESRNANSGTKTANNYFAPVNHCTQSVYPSEALTHNRNYFELPRVDESLDSLAGAKYNCTLDLVGGYVIRPDDRHFVSHKGLFEFTVMPFGLSNSPTTFQRLMELVFCGLQW